MPARIAVVIPCFNDAAVVSRAIASVQAQTTDAWELVVVDDGSTDDSRAVANTFAAGDARIVIVGFPENRGVAAAENAGVQWAVAPWVLILDADNVLTPRYLERITHAIDVAPSLDVVFSEVRLRSADPARHGCVYRFPEYSHERHRQVLCIPTCAAIRRSVWDAVGGRDETIRAGQDWEFTVRAGAAVDLSVLQLPGAGWEYSEQPGRLNEVGRALLPDLMAYWNGHTRENLGTRRFGPWLAQRRRAA